MSRIIAGRFDATVNADAAIEALHREGFNRDEIDSFYVAPPGQNAMHPLGGDAPHASAGSRFAGVGAIAGAIVGGLLGMLIGFAIDSRYWLPNARRIRVVAPDVDGQFEVPRLPPGDYAVVVNRRPEIDPLRDPSILGTLAGAATRVTVQLGTMSRTTLTVR